jgi:hypothetical protein
MRPDAADGPAEADPERLLRVVGLVYALSREAVFVAVVERGSWRWIELCPVAPLLAPTSALRDELADTLKVMQRKVPLLQEFATGWGRDLLPPETLAQPPDVLVVVPQEFIHQVPLHLVTADDGRALAVHTGVAYCSSLALFRRVSRRRRAAKRSGRVAAGAGVNVCADGPDSYAEIAADVLSSIPAGNGVSRSAAADEVADPPPVPATDVVYFNTLPPDGREVIDKLDALSRGRAKQLLSDTTVDVVCLVAHRFIDPQRHGYSGLLLTSGLDSWRQLRIYGRDMTFPDRPLRDVPLTLPIKREAEVLTLTELELHTTPYAEMMLLLACSAGSSVQLRADEPGSLAESLLRRGGCSVVAPMWDCDDRIVSSWTRPFLEAWITGAQPAALAVREGFRALGDGRDPSALSPFHLRGDWR